MKTLREICYIGAVVLLGMTVYLVTCSDDDNEVIPYKPIKTFTEKEKDSLEKQVEMDTFHIDNHEINALDCGALSHSSNCLECLKRLEP